MGVERPSTGPTVRYIFLDQNHWIYLAKAVWGQPHRPAHVAVASELARRVDAGDVRLPLNTIHLIEHLRAENAGRRQRLAEVFERFSNGWFTAAWSDILPLEMARAVASAFGERLPPPPRTFGRGFMFGVGPQGRETLGQQWPDSQITAFARLAAQPGALLDLLVSPNELGRRQQNQATTEVGRRNAEASETLRAARRPGTPALHRRAQYASYTYELQRQIGLALAAIGKTLDDFIGLGIAGVSDFWAHIPSLDVDCELTIYRDRQWSRTVHENDVRDIGHLAIAIPYFDAAVVERLWARAIQETGLAEKYGVIVTTDLGDLMKQLDR